MNEGRVQWLRRGEGRRDSALARHLLEPAAAQGGQETIAALQAELAEERERRIAITHQRDEQAAELAALRNQIETMSRRRRSSAAPEPPGPGPRLVELPDRLASPGAGYWLLRCEGFRVETDSGPVGRVEGVRFGHRHDRPDALVVVTGRWRRRRLLVPVEAVDGVSSEKGRITLSRDPSGWSPPAERRDDLARTLRSLALKLHRLLPDAPSRHLKRIP